MIIATLHHAVQNVLIVHPFPMSVKADSYTHLERIFLVHFIEISFTEKQHRSGMFLLQFVELPDKADILLCILLHHREKD